MDQKFQEIIDHIGSKMVGCRWDINTNIHRTIKLDMTFAADRQLLMNGSLFVLLAHTFALLDHDEILFI